MSEHKVKERNGEAVAARTLWMLLASFDHDTNVISYRLGQEEPMPLGLLDMMIDEALRQLALLRLKVNSDYNTPELAKSATSGISVTFDCQTKRVVIGGDVLPVPLMQMIIGEIQKLVSDELREFKIRRLNAKLAAEAAEAHRVKGLLDGTGRLLG